jgi:hypothetical protein
MDRRFRYRPNTDSLHMFLRANEITSKQIRFDTTKTIGWQKRYGNIKIRLESGPISAFPRGTAGSEYYPEIHASCSIYTHIL